MSHNDKPIVMTEPKRIDPVDVHNIEPSLDEDYALSLVNSTFTNYSAWRSQNLEPKWSDADALMNGVVSQRMWPGTNIPKAAFPQPIVSDNFRTILPLLEQAIFPDNEDWFDMEPAIKGQLPTQFGRMLTNTFKYYLDVAPEISRASGRREIIVALMDMLLYKVGGVHVYWHEQFKRPCIEAVNIRDIYFDPKAVSPIAEMNKSIIWRKFLTVRQIKEMRAENSKFKVPTDEELYWLAAMTGSEPADMGKNVSASMLGFTTQNGPDIYNPAVDDADIEVLIYYSKKRVIWVLNKTYVMYNEANDYGFFPFCFAPCFALPHKNFGESIPDLLKSSQRLSEGLINNYVDEIHLSLNPPRVEKLMSGQSNGDKWYPGLTIKTIGTPKEDIIFPMQVGATTQVWDLVQFISGQAYSRMGFNPMQVSGMPAPSNANRTAAGMQMQLASGSNRIYELVKQIEDYLLVPLLRKMSEYCRRNVLENEPIDGLNENGELAQINKQAFMVPLRLQVKCASRVISKAALAQIMPTIMQYIGNGQLVQQLHSIGKTVDFSEIMQAMMDSTGLGKKYDFIRDLTQQEIQQMQAQAEAAQRPDPTIVKTQMEIDGRLKETQMKGEYDLKKQEIAKAPSPMEIQAEQQKQMMEQQTMQMELQLKAYMAEMDKKMKEFDLMIKAAEANQKMQISQMEMGQRQQEHEQEMQMSMERGIQEQALAERKAAASMEQKANKTEKKSE